MTKHFYVCFKLDEMTPIELRLGGSHFDQNEIIEASLE